MNDFSTRHIGINPTEQSSILAELGYQDLDGFISDVIPAELLSSSKTTRQVGLSEDQALAELAAMIDANKLHKNYTIFKQFIQ